MERYGFAGPYRAARSLNSGETARQLGRGLHVRGSVTRVLSAQRGGSQIPALRARRPVIATRGRDGRALFFLSAARYTMSKFVSLYLGGEDDPKPVFRDDAPGALTWPDGAVMAVYFAAADFPGVHHRHPERVNRYEFFDAEGWPLTLPEERKRTLPREMKREFQLCPLRWRDWGARDWRIAHDDPTWFSRIREQAKLVRAIYPLLPGPNNAG